MEENQKLTDWEKFKKHETVRAAALVVPTALLIFGVPWLVFVPIPILLGLAARTDLDSIKAFWLIIGAIIATPFTIWRVVSGHFQAVAALDQARIAQENHITDVYTRAIEQLGAVHQGGAPNIPLRIGAIYSLKRIALSSERDRQPILEVLAEFVRANSPALVWTDDVQKSQTVQPNEVSNEVRAAIRTIGLIPSDTILNLASVNFRGADFSGLTLKANFQNSYFDLGYCENLCLNGSDVYSSIFRNTKFLDCEMKSVAFTDSYIDDCIFESVNFTAAHFFRARFYDSTFAKAILLACDLRFVLGSRLTLDGCSGLDAILSPTRVTDLEIC